ncbi:MAG: helix-turn-helix transcriptional regulator [Bacilli bacterium]|nr:helix-turn-helix transcriptional regulator [Bacilli bacterium]
MNRFPNEDILFKMRDMLSIVSDITRLKIMFTLLDDNQNEKCVSEIVESTGASQSLVSHQLKTLKDFDLVSVRRDGKKIYYTLKDDHVRQLISVALEHAMEEE